MINFSNTTKEMYKNYDRELSVIGNLYLASKRLSNNLLNESDYDSLDNCTYSNGIFKQITADSSTTNNLKLQGFDTSYTIIWQQTADNNISLGLNYFKFEKTSDLNYIRFALNGTTIDTGVIYNVSNLENEKEYYIGGTFTNIIQGTVEFEKIYISEYNTYEEYGTQVVDYSVGEETNNIFNIKNTILEIADGQEANVSDDKIFLVNNQNIDNWICGVRLINLNDYKGEYISLNFSIDEGYVELKRGTSDEFNNDTIIEWGVHNNYTYLVPNDLEGYEFLWITPVIKAKSMSSLNDIMVNVGQNILPYERYMSSPFKLTEENECKILSFNINEKTDIYYTSLPYNTMTIEVDNEKGYFTDYDENSILDSLNNDCYVDLFIKINDDNYYKIMTMNFDKISYSDYTKAKLSFYSLIGYIEKNEIKGEEFENLHVSDLENHMDFEALKNYLSVNYNINLMTDHEILLDPPIYADKTLFVWSPYINNCKNLRDIILYAITNGTGGRYTKSGALTITNYNNDLVYKKVNNVLEDTIIKDLQIERLIIKKENTYKGIQYTTFSGAYFGEEINYVNTIRNKLQSKRDVIVIIDNYAMEDITAEDITTEGNITLSIGSNSNDKILFLIVEGNIGEEYTININAQYVRRFMPTDKSSWNYGDTNDNSKVIIINENSVLKSEFYAFLFIKKPIKSYVEVKIMGLPYLEIGDTIDVELDNRNVKIVITEIVTEYNEGLIQTIKGYELDWTHQVPTSYKYGSYSDLNDWT